MPYFKQAANNQSAYESKSPWNEGDIEITKKAYLEWQHADAIRFIKSKVKPGQKVFTVLRNASRSGMRRSISCFVVHKGELVCLDYHISKCTGYSIDSHGGLSVGGCGMDMGFHLVYSLGRILWPKGTPKPHGTRNGAPDKDGGYALKQEWI